jgi:hypothetical protein
MKELSEFLKGKSEHTVGLFWAFIEAYREIGNISIEPAKTMIGIKTTKRIAYITRLGKDFMDVCFMFDQPYNDNLCFHKIAQVPGAQQYNHYFRMMNKMDLNKEIKTYMKRAISH